MDKASKTNLIKKAKQQEYQWLKAVIINPAFHFLKDPK